jgi:hypothetical protein
MASVPLSPTPLVWERFAAVPKLAEVRPASRLEIRPVPEMVSSGIRKMDALTGGLPRGCLTEICGTASSGRTSVLLAALAAATQRQEACALVDVTDAFDPVSATVSGVDFTKLLWIRCSTQRGEFGFRRTKTASKLFPAEKKRKLAEGPVEQALRVTDLLLQSGGFGLVMIDLADVPFQIARRIPLTTWFRFQRTVERTSTVLLVITPAPCAQTCATLLLKVSAKKLSIVSGRPSLQKNSAFDPSIPTHAQIVDGICVQGELLRSRLERKPAGSVTAEFVTKAVRIG